MQPVKIYCDESGYTGANLLEIHQPYFVYCGVRLTDEEKQDAVRIVYDSYQVQGEIKGRNLVQSEKGQNVVLKVFEKYAPNARIVFNDKKYVLAAKIFEYAIEPNLKSNALAYESRFNIFIASGLYAYFMASGKDAEEIFKLFLSELRGQNNEKSIFSFRHEEIDYYIFQWVFEIVKHNPQIFYSEIRTDGKVDSWILDLTSTSLMGILTDQGKTGDELTVICDQSNLFKENRLIEQLNKMGRSKAQGVLLGHQLGFNLAEDISMLSSKNENGLQIADLFASTTAYSLIHKETEFSKAILDIVLNKCLCKPAAFCVMPDFSLIDDKAQIAFYLKFMDLIREQQQME